MPLVYGDPTYAGVIAETAAQVGQAKQAEREAERGQQMQLAGMEIKVRRELAQFEADMRLQAAKLGQAWELEKMQRESELDFQFEQQKLTLNRQATMQKEAHAKEKYLAYVDYIDGNTDYSPKEKRDFKHMAYGDMVANVDVANRVYSPESYQKQGSLEAQWSGGLTSTASAVETAPVDAMNAAIDKARLSMGITASSEDIATEAETIVRGDRVNAEATRLMQQSPGASISNVLAVAERIVDEQDAATVEQQVRAGYEQSRGKPTLYHKWKKFVKGGGPAEILRKGTVVGRVAGALNIPEAAQAIADRARTKVNDGAVSSIKREFIPAYGGQYAVPEKSILPPIGEPVRDILQSAGESLRAGARGVTKSLDQYQGELSSRAYRARSEVADKLAIRRVDKNLDSIESVFNAMSKEGRKISTPQHLEAFQRRLRSISPRTQAQKARKEALLDRMWALRDVMKSSTSYQQGQ